MTRGLGRGRRSLARRIDALQAGRERQRGVQLVHFLHIGKTGGTALKAMLSENRPGSGYRLVLHDHTTGLADVPAGDKVIAFVRDPVARFESGFWSRLRQGRPRYNVPWTAEEARAFGDFSTPNELARALSDDDAQRRASAEQAMRDIHHIRDHLSHWFGDPGYLRSREDDVLFIGHTESLADDSARLAKLLSMPEQAALPTDSKASHRRPDEQSGELDEQATENLRRWYSDDYELLAAISELMAERAGA